MTRERHRINDCFENRHNILGISFASWSAVAVTPLLDVEPTRNVNRPRKTNTRPKAASPESARGCRRTPGRFARYQGSNSYAGFAGACGSIGNTRCSCLRFSKCFTISMTTKEARPTTIIRSQTAVAIASVPNSRWKIGT